MLTLAWRNVWRNRRRSLITIASLAFGLSAIMFGQSLLKTLQSQLIEKSTGTITGHLQIQHRNIKDYKFPERYIDDPGPAEAALKAHPRVKSFGKRIHVTGLVSSPVTSSGVLIAGVEPSRESRVTSLSSYLTQGAYLKDGAHGVVMGEKLAQKLDLRLGEKAVVMAQAVDGSMGAEAVRLVGLYRTGSTIFDTQIIYVPLATLQEVLGVGGKVNHIVVRIDDIMETDAARRELAETLGNQPVQVLSWKNVDREILGIQRFQNGLLKVVLVVVFLIVALGILNTLLMSLFERVREFGVLMAMGARPSWVMRLVLFEAASLGLVGAVLGLVLGAAIIAHYGRCGLHLPLGEAVSYFLPFPSTLYLRPAWASHAGAALCVMATSFLAALPPALRAGGLKPAEALRHV
ncbi:MAG: ABC transporter permease [Elusimicrobia bacterium]|nr:ABC transporter permease [Elusimicrobiota bacterium]